MDGILIIDKPAGITSHDVVARCRKILKTKRVGHTGTLDPFATGVMVILVGKATRLAQFLDKDAKEYEAVVRFGFETDTGDRTGRQKAKGTRQNISADEIENVLTDFRGEIEQTPPMYSAKKIDGKKLYELARQGIEVERKSVKVTIYELETIGSRQQSAVSSQQEDKNLLADDFGHWTLDFGLRVLCSAGTYIRVLAEDIGKKLGVGAHLAELRRTRAGNFELSKAFTLEELEKIAAEKLDDVLISMNDALSHLPKVVLNETEAKNTQNGIKLNFDSEAIKDGGAVRMTDAKENLVAVGFYNQREKTVQPRVVLL